MALDKIPPISTLTDRQFIQVQGPDQIITGYQYDQQSHTLYFKESQVVYPSQHGYTHISEDPIPDATCDTPGLMAADDKCKLDSLLGTRIGVAGWQGAGFPDDGGWMQGDIILAAGTEFIRLERIGNVVRFTVDSPVPLACSCESCSNIYFVQDESDVQAIRPPTCGGKMPGINGYGELKMFLFPESALFDPNNPIQRLNQKGQYPTLYFTRYNNTISPGTAEFGVVLKRDSVNQLQTEIGHHLTPGAGGVAECVWFVGKDLSGGQLRFDLRADPTPGMLGMLLSGGNLLTKRMAVITDYTSNTLSTNQYTMRWWDVDKHLAVGSSFTATNVWQYNNPTNPTSGSDPQQLQLDGSIDLLPLGTLVDIWFFKVGEVAGTPINRYYFNRRPELNPTSLWTQVGSIGFGDTAVIRNETIPDAGSVDKDDGYTISGFKQLERRLWGISGFDDSVLLYDDVASAGGTSGEDLATQHRAVIDTELPGLRVRSDSDLTGDYSSRPVFIWNRNEISNALVRADVGRPDQALFSPVDLLVNAAIDSHDELYLRVVGVGTLNSVPYVKVKGCHFHDLPTSGVIRVLTPGASFNQVFHYGRKLIWTSSPDDDLDCFVLLSDYSLNTSFPGQVGDVVELLHDDYNAPCIRVEFTPSGDTAGSMQVQFKVGELDMTQVYEQDSPTEDRDDYVRGLKPGYAVSQIYTQSASFSGVGTPPVTVPTGFIVYDGGAQLGGDQTEYWNKLEVLYRDGQCWVWWNSLLVAPSPQLSAALPTPVTITTPYFPLPSARRFGKVGLRLWPGATVRSLEVRTQSRAYSEFSNGQLSILG